MVKFIHIVETHGTIRNVKIMTISNDDDFVVFHLDRKWIFRKLVDSCYVKYDLHKNEAFNDLVKDRGINHAGFYRLKGDNLYTIRDNHRYTHLNKLIESKR